ncbi:MAG: DNA-protecting protein DprA [Deltaproteobacteria bacterium]|nr:DNA-protecting protein DprA [Deltaproteobacteria bacterium]
MPQPSEECARNEFAQGLLDPADRDPEAARRVDDWLELQRQLCFEPVLACRLLECMRGDPAAVLSSRGVPGRLGVEPRAAERRTLTRLGATLVPCTAGAYPAPLRALPDPPLLLGVRGEASALARSAVAIVGARAATTYGTSLAYELGAELARAGLVVVSGLARGVDAAAHRGALAAGGKTVAVLACGLDRIYPPEHRDLALRIAGQGAVASELPLGAEPRRVHFPMRNRIISGLCLGVVVVEARARSGSLITARHALDQGRDVLAVPGPVTAPTSAGPNALLRDGARPVLEVGDVLEQIGWMGGATACGAPAAPRQRRAWTPDERRVLDRLRDAPATRDELVRTLGLAAGELAALLSVLELDGALVEDRDGRLRLRPGGFPRTATGRKRG